MDVISHNRKFMQCPNFREVIKDSDMQMGLPHPPVGKERANEVITLPSFDSVATDAKYVDLLDLRRSERLYTDLPMSCEQLAFILWSAHGIQTQRGGITGSTLRPVPSGGASHPFEIYALVGNVAGIDSGIYRYAPLENIGRKQVAIEFIRPFYAHQERCAELFAGQKWVSKAAVVLFVSCVPYRAEWRYGAASHRVALIDLGHIGQNMMLSAAALGMGSCCLATYDQVLCDAALGLDGNDEFVVYATSVGNI